MGLKLDIKPSVNKVLAQKSAFKMLSRFLCAVQGERLYSLAGKQLAEPE